MKHREAGLPMDNSSMVEKEKRKNELKRNQMEKRNQMMAEYDAKIKRLRSSRQDRIDEQVMNSFSSKAHINFRREIWRMLS